MDAASGQSGLLTFHGYLDGERHREDYGYFYHLDNSWIVGNYSNPSLQTLQLGKNLYKVSITPFQIGYDYEWATFPQALGGSSVGNAPNRSSVDYARGMVDVQVTSATPEPSTLVLAASGIAVLGGRLWRRRQRGLPPRRRTCISPSP
jgi:hypothetical protein